MNKLNFYLAAPDGYLEAVIPGGSVHIYNGLDQFKVTAYYQGKCVEILKNSYSLYEALDKANEWWDLVNKRS